MNISEERIQYFLGRLYKYSFEDVKCIDNIGFAECAYKTDDLIPSDLIFEKFDNKKGWGGCRDSHYWFVFNIDIPNDGKTYALSVATGYNVWHASNPQFIVYIDGKIEQGLDENHTEIVFKASGTRAIWLYAYTGSEIDEKLRLQISLFVKREDVRKLYFELEVLNDVIFFSDENSAEYKRNLFFVNKTLELIDFNANKLSVDTVKNALIYLDSVATGNLSNHTVYCVGQTHIDLEWLWTLKQTKEKVQRSFSNVLKLMERYKNATFFASTPVLYDFIKETQPSLYKEIKTLIAEDRWGADGATYLECDTVLAGGESLLRQFLYGQEWFIREFGKKCDILWLPDCFGFSAALPQIAKQFGVEWLVTSKISWNDTNVFPHDIFKWKGIDGTGINTYFMTTQAKTRSGFTPVTVYNGNGSAQQIAGTYDRLTEKHLSDIALNTYGWGDGGGGPTEGMLEHIEFMSKGILGLPQVKNSTVREFFNDLDQRLENKTLPEWTGELYLEYHRGTYTAVSKVKKLNRQTETKLSNAELLCALNKDYVAEHIISGFWKTLLIHQFHDALPGSGIKEIYDDIEKDLTEINLRLDEIIKEQINSIIEKDGLKGDAIVFNFNSREVSNIITVNGRAHYIESVPAKGYKVVNLSDKETFSPVIAKDGVIENEIYKLTFDENLEIIELYDKRVGRNVIKKGERFNSLCVYNDINVHYDNWEISDNYTWQKFPLDNVTKAKWFNDGYKAGVKITRKFRSSTVKQEISLSAIDDLVRFDTEIDWKECDVILKSEFCPDINSDIADYNIQFGNIKRTTHNNTDLDKAQFEVPFHKYFDYSEGDYGIAIITDCKYGGAVKDGKMSLSLLKSSCYPYKEMDKCKQTFSYAIMPHGNTISNKSVIDTACEFNNPLYVLPLEGKGNITKEFSLISCDADNIVIETVKPSEDIHGFIVRFYDCKNCKRNVTFTLFQKARKIYECDMSEKQLNILAESTNSFNVFVANYQIKTVKILL